MSSTSFSSQPVKNEREKCVEPKKGCARNEGIRIQNLPRKDTLSLQNAGWPPLINLFFHVKVEVFGGWFLSRKPWPRKQRRPSSSRASADNGFRMYPALRTAALFRRTLTCHSSNSLFYRSRSWPPCAFCLLLQRLPRLRASSASTSRGVLGCPAAFRTCSANSGTPSRPMWMMRSGFHTFCM